MSALVKFDKVSKLYTLQRNQPRSARELFVNWLTGRWRPAERQDLWACRDLSFEIQRGETVGLLGPNGAGKSTALKLMSRIIPPTTGKIETNGRVTALLELGTGFHPELSGRENIFLSGALIGMGRAEMARKFDSIVNFSELPDFIDEPIKHYSSGMFARLAFAVSIHLDPEVLLVDEVLSVGDQNFQQKCLDRIAGLQRQGVTICMVSHAVGVIQAMCTRALWFDHGQILADSSADAVVNQYLNFANEQEAKRLSQENTQAQSENAPVQEEATPTKLSRWGNRQIEITNVRLTDETGQEQTIFETGQAVQLHLDYRAHQPTLSPIFGFAIFRQDGVHICGPNTMFDEVHLPDVAGTGTVTYHISYLPLLNGLYHVSVAIANHTYTDTYDYHDQLYSFRVNNRTSKVKEQNGLMTLRGQWQQVHEPNGATLA